MTEGNVVKDFNIGQTRIKICDDYCRNQTDKEVDIILKRCGEIAYKHLSRNTDVGRQHLTKDKEVTA